MIERLLYAPASARGVAVTRGIVALHALWLLLSRPCLHELFGWPRAFWAAVPHDVALRYGWPGAAIELPLFVALLVLLPIAMFSRAASLVASVLLYHFAPLEDAFITAAGPASRGLTVDVLALAVLAFAPRLRKTASGDFRWPVVLVRFAVASQYLFSTVAKLRVTGFDWFSGPNMDGLARTFQLLGIAPHPEVVIGHPATAWTIGIGWLALSVGMMIAVVSRRAAAVIVPLTAAAHIAAAWIFGIVWLAAPLLLVFADFGQSAMLNSSAQRERA